MQHFFGARPLQPHILLSFFLVLSWLGAGSAGSSNKQQAQKAHTKQRVLLLFWRCVNSTTVQESRLRESGGQADSAAEPTPRCSEYQFQRLERRTRAVAATSLDSLSHTIYLLSPLRTSNSFDFRRFCIRRPSKAHFSVAPSLLPARPLPQHAS